MAKLTKPPIPAKMYKHFAVATVSLTGAIAMFADDGNRQAVVEHVEERQEQERLQRASAAITDSQGLVRNDLADPVGGFGSEASGDYGSPTVNPGGAGGGNAADPRRRPEAGGGRRSVAGYDQSWIDALSEEDYRIFLESISDEALSESRTAAQRAQQQSSIEAESARRAGRSGRSADAPPQS